MPVEMHFEEGWRRRLAEVGLDRFDSLMAFGDGQCVSWHTRGQTYRFAAGETLYLKRDCYTSAKDVLADLVARRRPQPPCIVELDALHRMRELNIPAPQPVAWGQRRRLALPHQAVLVMRELPGMPLNKWLREVDSTPRRRAVLTAVAQVIVRLYAAGLTWPDVAPKHFFLDGERIGVLDLARMRVARRPRVMYVPKQVHRFCARLRACGAAEEEVLAVLAAMSARR